MRSTPLLAALAGHALTNAAPTTITSTSSQQLAGQRVICSYPGTTVPSATLDAVSQGLCSGIIFFGDNLNKTDPSVLRRAVQQLNAAQGKGVNGGRQLIFNTDQEGGEVRRLPGGPTQSAKEVGASSDPASAGTSTGNDAASTLKGAGLNMNLAPVLDVYRTAGDFEDQYQRSYSMDKTIVASAGSAFIAAEQGAGVLSTGKHFPGLGAASASENTDEGPVTINLSAATLRSVDMYPYQQAIGSAKLGLVMCSWALYPNLDAKYPAGISRTIVQNELRSRLGFKGVTITDAIEAGGLNGFGNDEQRSVLAARAGMDLILASGRNATQGPAIARALAAAYDNGSLDRTEFQQAVTRIQALNPGRY